MKRVEIRRAGPDGAELEPVQGWLVEVEGMRFGLHKDFRLMATGDAARPSRRHEWWRATELTTGLAFSSDPDDYSREAALTTLQRRVAQAGPERVRAALARQKGLSQG